MKRILIATVFSAVFLMLTSSNSTAEVAEVGHGARAIGMGQAQVAVANDHSAVYYNPACLLLARERWEMSGMGAWVQYGNSGYAPYLSLNGVDQEYPYVSATTIGAVLPLGDRLTAGVSVYFPEDWTLVIILNTGPRFVRFMPSRQPHGTYGVALKITDKLSIGASQSVVPQWNFTTINLDLAGILSGVGLSIGEPAVNINPHMSFDTLLGFNYQFGALYKPFKWVSLGANYTYKIGTDIYIPIYLPPSILPETSVIARLKMGYKPTRLSFGLGLYPSEHMTIAVDMAYDMWSQVNYHYLTLQSSNPDFLNVQPAKFELDDVWVPRVGFEYRNNFPGSFSRAEYAVRTGYSFYKSPYPEMPEDTWYIDNDAHYYSAGLSLGYHPKRRLKYIGLDYYWDYIDMVKRSHKDITRNPAVIVSDGYIIYAGFAVTIQL